MQAAEKKSQVKWWPQSFLHGANTPLRNTHVWYGPQSPFRKETLAVEHTYRHIFFPKNI